MSRNVYHNSHISQLSNDIELKLSTSIKEETMSTLKRNMLAEIQSLHKTITSLTARVKYLEETLHSYSCPVQLDVDNVSQLATNASPDQQQVFLKFSFPTTAAISPIPNSASNYTTIKNGNRERKRKEDDVIYF